MNFTILLRRGVAVAVALCGGVAVALWFYVGGKESAPAPSTSALPRPTPSSALASMPAPAIPRAAGPPAAPRMPALLPQPEPGTPSAQFFDWVRAYFAAPPADRATLLPEGIRKAQARRIEYRKLIAADPRRALEEAVPMVARQQLPAEIVRELETRLSGVGRFEVQAVSPDSDPTEPTFRRFATLHGREWRAHVYGAREQQMSQEQAMMNGVGIDEHMALSESPVRSLEIGEVPDRTKAAVEKCPVSGLNTAVEDLPGETPPAITPDTPAVEAGDQIIYLCDGGHIRQLVDDILAPEGATGGPTAPTSGLPLTRQNSTGLRRHLYMRLIFPDRLQEPQNEQAAWSNCRQLDEYFQENSSGKLAFQGKVTPVLLLPRSEAWYKANYTATGSNSPIMTDAKEAARAAGYPPEDFHHFVVLYSGGPGSFGGLGSVNGANTWLRSVAIGTFRHEIGHNIGVWHSNYWNTSGTSTIGPGTNEEYGHHQDVMGSSGSGGHFNASMKEQLQWLTPETYHTAAQSGVYRIFQFDQVNQDPARRFAVKVAKDADRDYWIEFRQKLTTNPWYSSGASINWSPWGRADGNSTNQGSNSGTQLLDMTPGSPDDKNDSPLVIGRTFSDTAADVHITPIAKGGTSPESLDVVVQIGTAATNTAPTLSIAPSATSIATGGAITFTATAVDPDGDPLAYHWTFGDKQTSYNGPTFSTDNSGVQTKTFGTAGWYAVQGTASDMKGGVARKTVLVQVGTPGNFTISGRVTDGALTPIHDVRVHNGQTGANFRGAYTDSDGFYVITNLAAGNVTVSATQAGSSFTPVFTNPITVGPSRVDRDFTANPTTRVTLEALNANAAEGGGIAEFRLSRTGSTASALAVHVDFSGSAASADYTLNPAVNTTLASPLEVFTIPAGASELLITLTPLQDTTQEGPETLVISLVNAGNTYLPAGPQTITLTIDDDDTTRPRVALKLLDSEATEASPDTAAFLVSRTGDTAAALTVNFAVDAAVLANAVARFATNGTDYTSIGASVVIPAGAASALITIAPIDDALTEGMELVKLTLTSHANYILDTATTATAKINDDDIATVTVAATDPTAHENGDTGTFTISRTGDTAAPLTVQYSTTGDALHGTDYQALPGFVTLPAGQATAQVRIIPIQDTHGEPAQSVVLQLRSAPHYGVAAPSSATITLTDDGDLPVVAVTLTDGIAEEKASADSGSFAITTTGTGAGNITVSYQITGTATSGVDFTALSGNVSLGRNASATITIVPINDSLPEDAETVTLTVLPSAAYQVDLKSSASLTIRDDDAVNMISVSPTVLSLTEGGGGGFYVSRTGSTTSALPLSYSIGGTADASDFEPLLYSVTIPAGATGAEVVVATINDSLAEGVETIELTILPDTGSPRRYGLEIPTARLTVLDNDSGSTNTVAFAQTSKTVGEGDGTIFLPVARSGAGVAGTSCSVEYSLRYATASGSGVDFRLATGRLDFAPGETVRNVPVELIDDVLPEGVEGLVVQLLNPSAAQIGANGGRCAVLILDNEPRILIEAVDPFATEGGDTAQFRLTRRGHTNGALNVPLSVSGTASSGTDFTALPTSVAIPHGQSSTTFTLTALADGLTEGPETVTVALAPSGTSLPGGSSSASIRIADAQSDDPPFLHLVSPRSSTPGVPANVFLHLDARATDDTPATLTTTWSRISGPGTVTFDDPAAPATRARFSVSGSYLLRLTASDGEQSATLDVTVTAGAAIQPWTNTNVGTVSLAGAAAEQHGQLALSAAGAAPTGTSDSLFFRHRPLTGNGEIVARVQHLVNTSTSARIGVMVRESTASNARTAAMFIAPSASFSTATNLTSFNYRPTSSVSVTAVTTVGIAPAWWLRLTRSGNVFTAFDSPDGATWTQRGTPQTLSIATTAQVGLAFSSATNSELSLGIVDNVRLTGAIENNGPLVDAGPNLAISVGATKTLAGSVTDDGRPGDPGSVVSTWSQVSGPGPVDFMNASSPTGGVIFSVPGTYVLRLTADDGEIMTSDEVTFTAAIATVTVTASAPGATEFGLVPGQFTVSRTGSGGNLPIAFSWGGTASPGADFTSVTSPLIIPDGSTSTAVPVTPLADPLAEGPETIVLNLVADSAYAIGAAASATVTLADRPVDQWRFQHFGTDANKPLLTGPTANPDFDVLNNLLEYAVGTLPNANSPSPIVADTVTIGADRFLRLTVPKNPAATDLQYQVRATSDLGDALSWSASGLIIEANTPTTLRVRDHLPLGTGTRFLRLFIQLP